MRGKIPEAKPGPRVVFRVFRAGLTTTWNEVFQKAGAFATEVGAGRLISIAHSADKNEGVVTVWYWSRPPAPAPQSASESAEEPDEVEPIDSVAEEPPTA